MLKCVITGVLSRALSAVAGPDALLVPVAPAAVAHGASVQVDGHALETPAELMSLCRVNRPVFDQRFGHFQRLTGRIDQQLIWLLTK